MASSYSTIIRTDCSGCRLDVKINRDHGTASIVIPSNGKRGSLHVPAHTVVADAFDDGELITWDCPNPACDYADSFDLTFED